MFFGKSVWKTNKKHLGSRINQRGALNDLKDNKGKQRNAIMDKPDDRRANGWYTKNKSKDWF